LNSLVGQRHDTVPLITKRLCFCFFDETCHQSHPRSGRWRQWAHLQVVTVFVLTRPKRIAERNHHPSPGICYWIGGDQNLAIVGRLQNTNTLC
jgi:hypothetical protein